MQWTALWRDLPQLGLRLFGALARPRGAEGSYGPNLPCTARVGPLKAAPGGRSLFNLKAFGSSPHPRRELVATIPSATASPSLVKA